MIQRSPEGAGVPTYGCWVVVTGDREGAQGGGAGSARRMDGGLADAGTGQLTGATIGGRSANIDYDSSRLLGPPEYHQLPGHPRQWRGGKLRHSQELGAC